jgi:hypothetical protein
MMSQPPAAKPTALEMQALHALLMQEQQQQQQQQLQQHVARGGYPAKMVDPRSMPTKARGMQDLPAPLDFPAEAWAAWLRFPPAHVATK